MMILKIDAMSDRGLARDNNEDMILAGSVMLRDEHIFMTQELNSSHKYVIAIADGIGGCEGGEIASKMIIQSLYYFVESISSDISEANLLDELSEWVQKVHTQVQKAAVEHPTVKEMGTTLTGVLLLNGWIVIFNIGDSRIYRFRNGILKQLTTDHSIHNFNRNTQEPSNLIYNAIGSGNSVFVDIDNRKGSLLPGDWWLLCSDGLSDCISEEIISDILCEKPTAEQLIKTTLEAGGPDNISVVLFQLNSI